MMLQGPGRTDTLVKVTSDAGLSGIADTANQRAICANFIATLQSPR